MSMEQEILIVEPADNDIRLDVYLSQNFPDTSRTRLQRLIKDNFIFVNSNKISPHYKVSSGDKVTVVFPPIEQSELIPETMPLDILYEDDDLVIINKPAGIIVHPSFKNYEHTLINYLLGYGITLSSIGAPIRPGIVHRLDKDTSGIIIVAKSDAAHLRIVEQFKNREVKKKYLAIVKGKPAKMEGRIETLIGRHPIKRKKMAVVSTDGKSAITDYKVLEYLPDAALIELRPYTGRTHQLRVHMAHLHHAIIGDPIYGSMKHDIDRFGLALCAFDIQFAHPRGLHPMHFHIDPPERFDTIISFLNLHRSMDIKKK